MKRKWTYSITTGGPIQEQIMTALLKSLDDVLKQTGDRVILLRHDNLADDHADGR